MHILPALAGDYRSSHRYETQSHIDDHDPQSDYPFALRPTSCINHEKLKLSPARMVESSSEDQSTKADLELGRENSANPAVYPAGESRPLPTISVGVVLKEGRYGFSVVVSPNSFSKER
jgi:hypothetical protein